jgi:hypothetical protein
MYKTAKFVLILLSTLAVTSLANISYHYTQSKAIAQSNTGSKQQVQIQEKSYPPQWMIILPILAVPFLFLAFKHREEDDMDDIWPYEQYSMGVKGGKAEDS